MDEAPTKRNVTFTKHLKQNRKLHHGFLSLHSSTAKVMLYDDSEQMLECRILKNDEVVCSSETLRFSAYLVDKVPKRTTSLHRNKFVNVSDCAGIKTKVEKHKQQTISLSPLQKIIRELKKNEMNRYGILQASPNSRTSSMTEWQVLYTTQITQKAKKYHDGFLQHKVRGSLGRQVPLYDASRKVLANKFLSEDKVLGTGKSLVLDSHIVDIGEYGVEEKVDKVALDDMPRVIGNYQVCVVKSEHLNSDTIARVKQLKLIIQFGVGLDSVRPCLLTDDGLSDAGFTLKAIDIGLTVFAFVGCMLLLPTILLIRVSTEDIAIMVELPLCDNSGVGIIIVIELGLTGF
ncbi:hypothetical protein ACJRO7_019830 [Eucalyptus globulus]|uniref:5'-3' DNA helicase ZGRF1-like N-terminal domain-containing protein n=1 Tax=Eucalyptus globulus TaxID=34317 RepID=A0ABD3KG91_EUCGL